MNVAQVVALLILLIGMGLLCGAGYVLFGLGWAMLAGAVCCFAASGVILRGL